MPDGIWIALTAIGVIAAVEVGQCIARVGFRTYCMLWAGTLFWIGEQTGLIQPPPTTKKPAKTKTRKDIKDL